MALTYHTILRQILLRTNSLVGVDAATLETTYTTSPLTASLSESADFAYTPQIDALINAEEMLAQAIADTGNHPWRSYLKSVTVALVHKSALPALDINSKQIIGIYGAVADATDGTVCIERSESRINRRVLNPGAFWLVDAYWFKIDGQRILHTRANVVIDVCIYDRAAQGTAVAGNTAMLLPEVLEQALVCGAAGMLMRDDAFTRQAQTYRGYFADTVAMIKQGLTSVPDKTVPGPTLKA